MNPTYTAGEVAEMFRCSTRKITNTATRLGVGVNLGGRAGYRFTAADVDRIADSMRPDAPVERRRRRRGAA